MTRQELIDAFSFEGINRSNAVVNFTEEDPFDPKAVWLNAEHIRALPVEELCGELLPFACAAGFHVPIRRKMLRITPLIQERIKLLRDVAHRGGFLFRRRTAALRQRRADPARKAMPPWRWRRCSKAREILADRRVQPRRPGAALRAAAQRLKIKAGQMFQPIRVAVCGRKNAPPLFETLEVLGRDTCPRASMQAMKKVESSMSFRSPEPHAGPSNFVRDIVIDDLKTNKYGGRVHTRFPPEPNGYLHIGHAKSINA
jgi:glutamyl-tRNA synthetase